MARPSRSSRPPGFDGHSRPGTQSARQGARSRPGRRQIACLSLLLLVLALGAAQPSRSRAVQPAPGATGAGWTALRVPGQAPPPRSQFGLASDASGDVYLYGGSGDDGAALADFWILRPAATSWTSVPNSTVPALIEPHLAVDSRGDVFEFGGIGNATGHHFTRDGHSFGLYEYRPSRGAWADLTPAHQAPGTAWPDGREDFGFGYDAADGQLLVFAGEGTGDAPLNDLWAYSLATSRWREVAQRYRAPGDATIDPREIYNISYDNHGGFFLFGGSYLAASPKAPTPPLYVNDLWRFDVATSTWTLLDGMPNAYSQFLPIPRHYYGQTCDAAGNFYLLDGYVSDSRDPPFFQDDLDAEAAQPVSLDGAFASGIVQYAIADFWRYDPAARRWTDLSRQMGDLTGQPAIPYAMVDDAQGGQILTFGGFHPAGATLRRTNRVWVYRVADAPPTATATARAGTQTRVHGR